MQNYDIIHSSVTCVCDDKFKKCIHFSNSNNRHIKSVHLSIGKVVQSIKIPDRYWTIT
jgi:hypothetical protein